MEDSGNIVIFESEGGDVRLDVRLENENVWLTQQQMALLYGKATSTINEHIGDIFEDKELLPDACRKKFGNSEFQQKAPYYFNLDMIIAVGFRVRSRNGVVFRQWATERIHEYIVKGFTMDDGRLQESFGINNLIVYGEHIDWHEQSGEGYFLCSSFLYPTYNPKAPGLPAYEMDRQRFVIKGNHISDIILEMEKTVFPA